VEQTLDASNKMRKAALIIREGCVVVTGDANLALSLLPPASVMFFHLEIETGKHGNSHLNFRELSVCCLLNLFFLQFLPFAIFLSRKALLKFQQQKAEPPVFAMHNLSSGSHLLFQNNLRTRHGTQFILVAAAKIC
jgi:hypothetical protein